VISRGLSLDLHLSQGAGFHQACSTFARCLLDVCLVFAMFYACFIFALRLLDVCSIVQTGYYGVFMWMYSKYPC